MIEENLEKTSVRLVGTGIWTRDLPNASLVRYHGATPLGSKDLWQWCFIFNINLLENIDYLKCFSYNVLVVDSTPETLCEKSL